MIFPIYGGAHDGNSVFVTIKNTTGRILSRGDEVLFPDDVVLDAGDARYLKSGAARMAEDVLRDRYGLARLLTSVFNAN